MKGFVRAYPLFSLCGLNCMLCTMHIGGYCPGCGGGDGNQGCAIARCGMDHGVEFCSDCGDYPCAKYEGIDRFDSFITHRNQKRDLDKVRRMGLDAYCAELDEKAAILQILLEEYNDGRKKTLFSAAVNLLELAALRPILGALARQSTADMTEKAALAAKQLQAAAAEQGISLRLRKQNKTVQKL